MLQINVFILIHVDENDTELFFNNIKSFPQFSVILYLYSDFYFILKIKL